MLLTNMKLNKIFIDPIFIYTFIYTFYLGNSIRKLLNEMLYIRRQKITNEIRYHLGIRKLHFSQSFNVN